MSSESSQEDGIVDRRVSKLRFFCFVWFLFGFCNSSKIVGVYVAYMELFDQNIFSCDCLNRLKIYSQTAFKSFYIVNPEDKREKNHP